ncbi:MAG: hypothetical protein J6C58_08675 [Bacteroidaceae bacterium]|nr:hypothetical protein [Bacteroidaceae bacterium]
MNGFMAMNRLIPTKKPKFISILPNFISSHISMPVIKNTILIIHTMNSATNAM